MAGLLAKDIIRPERRLPVVTTLHGTDITIVGQDPAYARVTNYAIRRSDAVTSVSEYLQEETRRQFEVDRPIIVIPNFVDVERFRPGAHEHVRTCFAPHDERVLLHMSNFRPVKRAVKVVEAFATVHAEMPSVLLMVGDGPDRPACEARARDLGLRRSIRFLGAQADVERVLPVADLFLLPSEYESFGLSALEAMSCGAVPVVSRAGGLPEVITDGQDGLLVPEEEIDRMGEHALALLGDGARLEALKAGARQTAVERFTSEAVVPRYEALYQEVLQAP
jgi:N-acetyl-alpha-D-glucosaminyl L-malate synthase BshA